MVGALEDACPDPGELVAFVRGEATNREAVEHHIASCAICRATVSALARDSQVASPSRLPTLPQAPEPAEESAALAPGTSVGRYQILGLEGRGGMGVVYAARDPELERTVAVKLLRRDLGDGARVRFEERLRREARALAQLAHPNVVTVHDVGMLDGQLFIAMEYVAGLTLRRWLDGAHGWRQVLAQLIAAGQGLAAAHHAGLVHRDFKPDNVLLGDDGRTRVADFGLVGPVDSVGAPVAASEAGAALTGRGAVLGTPRYMAPEQRRGEPADAASDQFAFCVALHEALRGEHPFLDPGAPGAAPGATSDRVREPPRRRVPARVQRVIARGLSAERSARWPSMQVLLARLERAARPRWPVVAVCGGLLLLAGGMMWTGHLWGKEQPCQGAGPRLAQVWNPARRAAIEAGLRRSGAPFAEATIREIDGTLDAYAARWAGMHTEACEASRVRGEQTEDQLGLRMTCLDERLRDLGALGDRLTDADRIAAGNAVQAAHSLPEIDGCADLATLALPVRPPTDPAARQTVDALAQRLAQVGSLRVAGAYRKGLDAAGPLASDARGTGYRPLEARSALVLGELSEDTGDLDGAEQALREAVLAAEAGRDDETAIRAWTALLRVVGHDRARYDQAPEIQAHAAALLERNPRRDDLRIELDSERATVAFDRGKLDEAEAGWRAVLARIEHRFGVDDLRIAGPLRGLASIARNRLDPKQAREPLLRLLAEQRSLYGDNHPEFATTLAALAEIEYMSGEYARAEADIQRVVEIRLRTYGDAHPLYAAALSQLANVLEFEDKTAEAVALHRKTVAILERAFGPDHVAVADKLGKLAAALQADERPAEAAPLLTRVLAIYRKNYGDEHPAIARALFDVALVKLDLGDPAAALDAAQRSLAMSQKLLGPTFHADTHQRTIGACYLALGHPEQAIEPLTQARDQAPTGDPGWRLWASALLAQALYESGRDRAGGIAMARAAEAGMQADARMDGQRVRHEQWMRRAGIHP